MRELFLPCGRVTLISDIDYERCRPYAWYASENNASGLPYVRTTIKRKTVYMQRFITNCPPTLKVDHRNNDTLDNQRPNLRITNFGQNNTNRSTWSGSGFKGVSWDSGSYRVRVSKDGEHFTLGRFKNAVEAAQVYDDYAYELFGEFAWLNFPERHLLPSHDRPQVEIPF